MRPHKNLYLFIVPTITLLIFSTVVIGIDKNLWASEQVQFIFAALIGCTTIVFNFHFKNKIRINIIDLLMVIYFMYITLSTILLAIPYAPSDKIYSLLSYFVFYILLRSFLFNGKHLNYFFRGVLLFTIFQGILGILQYLNLITSQNLYFKVLGTFTNPGIYGGFIAIGLPLSVYFLKLNIIRPKRVICLIVCMLILTISLIVSGSRTACISAVFGTICILFHQIKKLLFEIQIHYRITLIILLFLSCTIFLFLLIQINTLSIIGRLFIWKISWSMFVDHPIFGIGYGKYAVEYGNYQAIYFSGKKAPEYLVQLADMNYTAFNELIKLCVENGIIGLGLFTYIITKSIQNAITLIQLRRREITAPLSMLVTIICLSFFSYPFDNITISLLFYLSIALISSCSINRYFHFYTFRQNKSIKASFTAILILFVFGSIRKVDAINTWKSAHTYLLYSEKISWEKYQKAYSTLSNNSTFLYNYGAEFAENKEYYKALNILNRAKKYGNCVELHSYIGYCYTAVKAYPFAEKAYTQAVNMNPKLFQPLADLQMFYMLTKQQLKAKQIAKIICEKKIKIPSTTILEIKNKAHFYLQKNNQND